MAATSTKTVTKTASVPAGTYINIQFSKVAIPNYKEFVKYTVETSDKAAKLAQYNTQHAMNWGSSYTNGNYINWTDGGYPTITVSNSNSSATTFTFTITFTFTTVDSILRLADIYPLSSIAFIMQVKVNGSIKSTFMSPNSTTTLSYGDRVELITWARYNNYVYDHIAGLGDGDTSIMPKGGKNLSLYFTTGYKVSKADNSTNGDISFESDHYGRSTDGYFVKSGSIVTIYPSPDEGYIYKDCTVREDVIPSGSIVTITKTQFTMPSMNVKIYPHFIVKPNSVVGYYNGTEFIPCTVNYYDGAQFVECETYYYDGTDWVPISTT